MQAHWSGLHAEAVRAERLVHADPRVSCFYARRALKATITWLYEADRTLQRPYRDDLSAMLFEPTLRSLVGLGVHTKMDLIRRQGNTAVHRARPITARESLAVVRDLFQLLYWLARRYTRDPTDLPPDDLAFDPALVPRPADVRVRSHAELRALATQLAERDEQLATADRLSGEQDAEIVRLRDEVAAANPATPPRQTPTTTTRHRPAPTSSTSCWPRRAGCWTSRATANLRSTACPPPRVSAT